MQSLGWALIQCDWCPYKSGNLDADSVKRLRKMPREDRDRDWSVVAVLGEPGR